MPRATSSPCRISAAVLTATSANPYGTTQDCRRCAEIPKGSRRSAKPIANLSLRGISPGQRMLSLQECLMRKRGPQSPLLPHRRSGRQTKIGSIRFSGSPLREASNHRLGWGKGYFQSVMLVTNRLSISKIGISGDLKGEVHRLLCGRAHLVTQRSTPSKGNRT